MRYALAALRLRNDKLRSTVFTEKVKHSNWFSKVWNEFQVAIKRGEVKGLWLHDEDKVKQIIGDIVEATIAGSVGATVGLASGNLFGKALARFATGGMKGFVRTLFRAETQTHEAIKIELVKEAEEDVHAARDKFRELEKNNRTGNTKDVIKDINTNLTRLKGYRQTKGLFDQAPKILSEIDLLISQYEILLSNLNQSGLTSKEEKSQNDEAIRQQEMFKDRLQTISRPEQKKQVISALKAGAKEGGLVAAVGGAFDFLRSEVLKDTAGSAWKSLKGVFSSKEKISPELPEVEPDRSLRRPIEADERQERRVSSSSIAPDVEAEETEVPVLTAEKESRIIIKSGDNPWNLIRQMLSDKYGEAFNQLPAGSKNYVIDFLKDQYVAMKEAQGTKNVVVEDGRFWPGKWFNVNPLVERAGGWEAVEDKMALVDPNDYRRNDNLINQLARSQAIRAGDSK